MNIDQLHWSMKELIFPHFSPDDWINTAKVSREWRKLTLESITKIDTSHVLLLDHLAECINQQENTEHTWISLLTMMRKLEHLECIEDSEPFWEQVSQISNKLKVLRCRPRPTPPINWDLMNITFNNLSELFWKESEVAPFPLRIFSLAPKLLKVTLKGVEITNEWEGRIPNHVKHILLDDVDLEAGHQYATNFLCQDSSSVETFSVDTTASPLHEDSQNFNETPNLRNIELKLWRSPQSTTVLLLNAFLSCRNLETVKADSIRITWHWSRVIPKNVQLIEFFRMEVDIDLRSHFSFEWLCTNYGSLHTINVELSSWIGLEPQNFRASENLKTLALSNGRENPLGNNETNDPFPDICHRLIRGSHLVEVTLSHAAFQLSWEHIFPKTVRKLNLQRISLSEDVLPLFSPQFILENPSNVESFEIHYDGTDLPAMNENAFVGMDKLKELQLYCSPMSTECLQSILTHCSALTDLYLLDVDEDGLRRIPPNLTLPSLNKLCVQVQLDEPSSLLRLFTQLRYVDIEITALEECFWDAMSCLQNVVTAQIVMQLPIWHLVRDLIATIDRTPFKYFCLLREYPKFSFYLTNSLTDASTKLCHRNLEVNWNVLWCKHYPNSPLLRRYLTESLPSNMRQLYRRIRENDGQMMMMIVDDDDDDGNEDDESDESDDMMD